jgi:tagatose 1,6-diphosphate aldolase
MKALSNKDGVIAAAAIDQRGSLQKSIAKERGVPEDQVTPEMLSEFKTAVVRLLTPYASAVLLDPEFGLPAAAARAKNAGLLLAYEESGYDNTAVGRLPDLLPNVSVKRLIDWGADAVRSCCITRPSTIPRSTTSRMRSLNASARSASITRFHFSWSSWGTIPRARCRRRVSSSPKSSRRW